MRIRFVPPELSAEERQVYVGSETQVLRVDAQDALTPDPVGQPDRGVGGGVGVEVSAFEERRDEVRARERERVPPQGARPDADIRREAPKGATTLRDPARMAESSVASLYYGDPFRFLMPPCFGVA